jgi:hypothetical protein
MRRDQSDSLRTASSAAFNHTNRRVYSEEVPGGSVAIASFQAATRSYR